ncbi:nicotinate-nucleotide--dimethylbenzimidazole phosphoribosyltransferase [Ancylobacter sp. MQZ15Z-1]|uniref:Nicotinate-nucleotide--dimethylbenzimidazole phosphoribosyltransferase n=1 Tax=Ancylobacter mangrovi TaxID=2972472 RepID=A0A9X2T5R1_9HYPH|nr:nicotinate-nucleotide--dimethylbenzimidazole phosphoribosyltransferase [Ancylobacter mangrovi]MCS0495654.1 nicotinate-nucleotide--dimethylbenzimidazole phosphoribosyltransferase [Ancylobacter mangrovi]
MDQAVAAPGLERFARLAETAPEPDEAAARAVRARQANLTKPPGSLGRLEEIAEWLAAWQGREMPAADRVLVAIFAGNHGVAARGVSAYPAEVTAQMVANFSAGGAAINQLARAFGLALKVVPLDLARPTQDFTLTSAMSEEDCAQAMECGAQALDDEIDLLCIGEMGIGNTTAAAALFHALFGGEAAAWVGPGTGVQGPALQAKVEVVEAAARRARQSSGPGEMPPLGALRQLGGREIAAMAGAILAARHRRVPVLVDGFVATAAAAVVHRMAPGAIDHCLVGHLSAEPAHERAVRAIGKRPLLSLDMRLGEGSGAALAVAVAKAAVATHSGMATFESAAVSRESGAGS